MNDKTLLKLLFSCILIAMVVCTVWASSHQPVQDWHGLTTGLDRYWTGATMLDAYCGFLTFYCWVFYKEQRWLPRAGWFIGIMLLGNMAMSVYVLRQLWRLAPTEPVATLLTARNT